MYLCKYMKFLKPVLAVAVIVFGFSSCKNDLKLNAPYKEIPSIYAVMNPQDKIQIIRINKVFLGELDANQMAQIADSINYPENELVVTLTRKDEYGTVQPASKNNNITVVFRDSVIQAEAGAFNKTQRVYVSSEPLFVNGKYTLTVKNNKTGNVFTASATSLDSVAGQQPFLPLQAPYYPYAPIGPPNDNSSQFINYKTGGSVSYIPVEAKNGKIYSLTIRMHFYDSLFNGQKDFKYVDYQYNNRNIKDMEKIANISVMKNSFTAEAFFSALGVNLSKLGLSDNIVGRKMYKIQYLIYSSSQEYIDYMQYVLPSLSISQSKPLYSNFDKQAALGLFTFRTRCSVSKQIANEFINEFAYNPYTCSYSFFTAGLLKPGCN